MRNSLVFFVLVLFTLSCTYEPTSNHTNTEIKEPTSVYLDIESSEDTLYLWGEPKLKFVVNSEAKLLNLFLKINGSSEGIRRSSMSEFEINTYLYKDTTALELTLHSLSRSETGSIADQFEIEALETKKSWVLFIDNTIPQVNITSVAEEDGALTVRWEKYEKENFRYYILRKTDPNNYTDEFIFTDRNFCRFRDQTYIEGTVTYQIAVKSSHRVSEFSSLTHSEETFLKKFNASYSSDGVELTWSKYKYHSNFNEYKIDDSLRYNYRVFSSKDVNDTSHIDKNTVRLADNKYSLRIFTKNLKIFKRDTTVFSGKHSNFIYSNFYLNGTNAFYHFNGKTVNKYDGTNFTLSATHHSKNEIIFYTFDKVANMIYYADKTSIYFLNPNTMMITKKINVQDYIGSENAIHSKFDYKNNTLCFIAEKNYQSSNSSIGFYIINISSSNVIELSNHGYLDAPLLSSNGQKLALRGELFSINNNGITKISDITRDGFQTYNGNYVFVDTYNVYLYDSNLGYIISQQNKYSINVQFFDDPKTNRYGLRDIETNKFQFYNKESGSIYYSNYVSDKAFMLFDNVIYGKINSKIFSSDLSR